MIRVVPGVPYGQVPEETTVRPQGVVHPGLQLPPQLDHTSCLPVPGPGVPAQTKVSKHILQYRRFQSRRKFLIPLRSFRARKVGVEISDHQQFGPVVALSSSRDVTLNGRGVSGGEVAYDNVPSLLPHHQMEADDVGSELL